MPKMPKRSIDDQEPINPSELEAYNEWRKSQGLPMEPIKHPKTMRGFSLSDEAMAGLDKLAIDFGFTHARSGNISKLLEAIGQGIIKITD